MNLYCIIKDPPYNYEDIYKVYVIASSAEYEEYKARTTYWRGQKCKVTVNKIDMTEEKILGTIHYYR